MLSAAQSKEELLTTMPMSEDYNPKVVNFDYLIDFGGRFASIHYDGVYNEDILRQILCERFGHGRFKIKGLQGNCILVEVNENEIDA